MRIFEGFQKGVNLGGWLSQFDIYSKEHFDTFTVEDDIRKIAGYGFDHVRVPVDYIVLEDEDGNPKEEGFQYLENCRQWCCKYGLNMIIDLHECFGYFIRSDLKRTIRQSSFTMRISRKDF
jgi:Endoglucanase